MLLQLNYGLGLPCKVHNFFEFPFIRMYATNNLRKSLILRRGSLIPCKKQGTFSPSACATSTQQHDFRWPFAGDRFSLHKLDANLDASWMSKAAGCGVCIPRRRGVHCPLRLIGWVNISLATSLQLTAPCGVSKSRKAAWRLVCPAGLQPKEVASYCNPEWIEDRSVEW